MNEALELWKELFNWTDTPYKDINDWPSCFFCGEDDDSPHDSNCIWIRAKKLVEESKDE